MSSDAADYMATQNPFSGERSQKSFIPFRAHMMMTANPLPMEKFAYEAGKSICFQFLFNLSVWTSERISSRMSFRRLFTFFRSSTPETCSFVWGFISLKGISYFVILCDVFFWWKEFFNVSAAPCCQGAFLRVMLNRQRRYTTAQLVH